MICVFGNFNWATAVHASGIETLVMPGEVSEAHAELETECINCHEPFDKSTQTAQCLACHTEIREDLASDSGFHGRSLTDDNQECKNCHTEHEGRQADIVFLDVDVFNHELTDFVLRDSHSEITCVSCHEPDKRYAEAPSSCNACHREDEPHRGELGESCGDCHQETRWDDIEFNHDETDFPLTGKHADSECASCHVNERYEGTPTDCYACHQLDDSHNGGNGTACGDCHETDAWKEVEFDHDTDTDFPLLGAHSDNVCEDCHQDGNFETPLETQCVSCHATDDPHSGRNGTVCEDCHSSTKWEESKFGHEKETGFPLLGAHGDLQCQTCHVGGRDESLESDCYTCHKGDDVHDGDLGQQCGRCHNETSWSSDVIFDHDLTKFPLIGHHAVATCESCHLDRAYKETESTCSDCHAQDDSHDGALGENCGQCHNPNGWNLWEFDHNRQTNFIIEGAHTGLECNACHRTSLERHLRVATRCVACHRRDDTHDGRFGNDCQQCHTTDSFRSVTSRL